MRLVDEDATKSYLLDGRYHVEPLKHGRWIREWDMRGNVSDVVWSCSVCGTPKQWYTTNFCPNCGAKMDGENDEID